MYSSLFNLIGCGKSCCTRRHDTSHNYEFGIMAKQDRTNLLSVCPLLNSYDKMLSVKRSYMHTCHFIRVEQSLFLISKYKGSKNRNGCHFIRVEQSLFLISKYKGSKNRNGSIHFCIFIIFRYHSILRREVLFGYFL